MFRLAFAMIGFAAVACAQKFEVASIKPNNSGGRGGMIRMAPGGRFTATNITVKQLITMAYGIQPYQLKGVPGWAETERYDVIAKPEGAAPEDGPPPNQIPTEAEIKTYQEKLHNMMQDLFATRFALKVHRETKDMPVYALVVAKNGPKLEESKQDAPDMPEFKGIGPANGEKQSRRGPLFRIGRGQITAQEMRMTALANQLSMLLGRNVIDTTGLTGKYDVKLTWTPDEAQPGAFGGPDGPGPAPAAQEPGPSIFTALQEQLGLKLDSQKGPVELVVVDSIQKPTEN